MIVYGKTKAEHNRNLRNVFVRLRESNITLNRKKCEFNCTELKFYGFIFSEKGMTADPEKVASIIQLEKPTNVSEMKSLLGMTGYSSRFVKGYSDKIQPLRQLTHQDTKWVWEKQHDDAFEEIKKSLATRPTLAYFDPRKKTTLTVDASPTGLGGILSQQDDREERGPRSRICQQSAKRCRDTLQPNRTRSISSDLGMRALSSLPVRTTGNGSHRSSATSRDDKQTRSEAICPRREMGVTSTTLRCHSQVPEGSRQPS